MESTISLILKSKMVSLSPGFLLISKISNQSPPLKISFPLPPLIVSFPLPADIISSPSPPLIVPLEIILSFPAVPEVETEVNDK